MGLPEERGRGGSGGGGREEAGARSRARSWSPPPELSRSAHVSSLQRYRELHRVSVEEPRGEAGPARAWGRRRGEEWAPRAARNRAGSVGGSGGSERRSGLPRGVGDPPLGS